MRRWPSPGVIAAGTKRRKHFEQQSRRGNAGRAGGLWGVLPSLLGQQFRIDAMAVSIVRLYRECDELRASLAMVEAERDLLRGKLNNLQGGQNE
jgi:hypothetical protein